MKKDQKYVIGVDGGGTKTVAAIANLAGEIIKKMEGGSTNYLAVGEAKARNNLKKLVLPFLQKYRNIESIAFGFAGLNNKKDFLIFQRIVKEIMPRATKFSLYNDAQIAIKATGDERPRILIIAGTGSAVLGEYRKEIVKAGGRDFLLSDEGGAYDFGMRALRSAVKSFDGRGQKTILEKLILKKARTKDIPSLITKIHLIWQHKPEEFKKYIASFGPLVGKAYNKRDGVAREIIKEGAKELFLGARAVIKKLGVENKKICIGYVGSNFKTPLLKDLLSKKIKKLASKAYFIDQVEPVMGAVKLAIEQLKKNC